jgi:hypothetical protein
MKFALIALIFALVALSAPVFSISLNIEPFGLSTTVVKNVDCGKEHSVASDMFKIENHGKGGVLCWYYTNENDEKTKLTTSCISPGAIVSYPVNVTMPMQGNKTVDVRLECFEFYNETIDPKDTCRNSYSYQEALDKMYSCSNSDGSGCLGSYIDIRSFDLSCDMLDFSFVPLNSTLDLFSGQSATIAINLTNNMNSTLDCDYPVLHVSNYSSSLAYNAKVTGLLGFGTVARSFSISCSWVGGSTQTKTAQIAVNYRPNPCTYDLDNAYVNYTYLKDIYSSIHLNLTVLQSNAVSSYLSDAITKIEDGKYQCKMENLQAAFGYAQDAISDCELASRIMDSAMPHLQNNNESEVMAENETSTGKNVTIIIAGPAKEISSSYLLIGIAAACIGFALYIFLYKMK